MKIAAKTMLTLFFVSTAILLSAQEYGVASYYSDKFHGKSTASGETYDKDKYTAAHKSYAFGTIIKVTRLDNKKSVKVRVTDRGPYVNGRIVDLSRKAAESLGLITDGTARVKVEVVDQAPDSDDSTTEPIVVRPPITQPEPPVITPQVPSIPKEQPIEQPKELVVTPTSPKVNETIPAAKPTPVTPAPVAPSPVSLKSELVTKENYSQFGLYKIALEKPSQNGYAVQVASMTNYNSVMKQIAELQGNWFTNILLSVEPNSNGEPVFKLLLGPFENQASATAYKASVKKKTGISGFVVSLDEIKY